MRTPPELAVLDAVGRGHDRAPAVVAATGLTVAEVDRVLTWATGRDLVDRRADGGLRLSETGRAVVDVRHLLAPGGGTGAGPAQGALAWRPTQVDLPGVARRMGELTQHARQGRDAVRERSGAGQLLEPAARDDAVVRLNTHFVDGLLDSEDRERRVGMALAARTRGDLAEAFRGLPVPPMPTRTSRAGAAVTEASKELSRTLFAIVSVCGAISVVLILAIVLILVLNAT